MWSYYCVVLLLSLLHVVLLLSLLHVVLLLSLLWEREREGVVRGAVGFEPGTDLLHVNPLPTILTWETNTK